MNNEELEILAREHFPEDTGMHIAMREVWIERYINNTNNNNTNNDNQNNTEIDPTHKLLTSEDLDNNYT